MRKWCSRDGLPHIKLGAGRDIRIDSAVLAEWVRSAKPNLRVKPSPALPARHAGAGLSATAAIERAVEVQSTRLKREHSRASLDELKLAQALGRLVAAEDVEKTWSTAVGNMAQQLDKLPEAILPHAVRLTGRLLEQLNIRQAKDTDVAGALEELKTLLRQELDAAVETVKSKLHQLGVDDHGEEQAE